MNNKEINEIRGFEETVKKMKMTDKVFSVLLLLKILTKVNGEQRRFFLKTIKKYLSGEETNFGNSFAIMSFNDYANNISLSNNLKKAGV